ncbi:hypothetical protein HDR60_05655 [bacterium]|nr:hypothetical protein [bacterium]
MNNNSIVKKLILIVFIALILRFLINIFLGKYNIFNYLEKKHKIETLTIQLENKTKLKEKLLYEVNILKDESIVNIDILEKETIKKLNKIPKSYFMITD